MGNAALLPIWGTLRDAWHHVKGTKGPIFVATILMMVIMIAISALVLPSAAKIFIHPTDNIKHLAHVKPGVPLSSDLKVQIFHMMIVIDVLSRFAFAVFATPFVAGIVNVTLSRVRGTVVSMNTVFEGFRRFKPVIGLGCVMAMVFSLLDILKSYFIVEPTVKPEWLWSMMVVYIMVSFFFMFGFFFIMGSNSPVFRAIGRSFCLFLKHWWRILLILIMTGVIFGVVAVMASTPGYYMISQHTGFLGLVTLVGVLLVAMIWMVPFLNLVPALIYHQTAE